MSFALITDCSLSQNDPETCNNKRCLSAEGISCKPLLFVICCASAETLNSYSPSLSRMFTNHCTTLTSSINDASVSCNISTWSGRGRRLCFTRVSVMSLWLEVTIQSLMIFSSFGCSVSQLADCSNTQQKHSLVHFPASSFECGLHPP